MDLIFSNIPRILTAFAESLACLLIIISFNNKRKYWPLRFSGFALGQVMLQLIVESWPLSLWILGMAINILWMYMTIYSCSKQDNSLVLYGTMKAFIFAEFSASFSWLLSLYIFSPHNNQISTAMIIVTTVINSIVATIYYFWDLHQKEMYQNVQSRNLLITLFTCIIIFLMSNLGFLLSDTNYPLGDASAVFIFRTMIDSLGLAIIYIQESQRRENHLEDEINAINNAMYYQYRQHYNYRQNNTLIDQKVHDLKHQLQLINMEATDSKVKQQALNDIEELIKQYDATVSSGNPVLDTVLTQKNLMCLQNNIAFSCMADGSSIDFMDTLDIYSLFGNALDNAYESVSQLTGNQRVINLKIFSKDDFVIINIENPYAGNIEYENGFPKTTKKDTHYHGYGVKSMSYIVDKYNGHLSMNDEDDWFKLKILFSKSDLN